MKYAIRLLFGPATTVFCTLALELICQGYVLVPRGIGICFKTEGGILQNHANAPFAAAVLFELFDRPSDKNYDKL